MAGRPKKGSAELAPLESEVMEAVWQAEEPVPVRHVLDALNTRRAEPLAYTTVMTVMNRLAARMFSRATVSDEAMSTKRWLPMQQVSLFVR